MKEQKKPNSAETSDTLRLEATSDTAAQLRRHFILLLIMDLLARTGYQMGKSPVLPLFAKSLGAGTKASGAMVAVSTTTGLISSPLIGTLSDRYGRRRLLIAGTAMFAFMPFVYLFIRTSGQLFFIRLLHGLATATYGPVMAALIADMFRRRRAEYMGWYRAVRTSSYLLGPLLGGFVLFYTNFRLAWVAVGIFGFLAFFPTMALPKETSPTPVVRAQRRSWTSFRRDLFQAFRKPVLLALGVIEAALYLGLRANKAFLPLYAVSVGINPAQIGIVFSTQVATTLLAQPFGGYLGDRMGRKPVIVIGLLLVGIGLPLMVATHNLTVLIFLSIVLGLGEAAIMPSVIALGTELSSKRNYGSTLGMLDAMDNVGKALGPIVAGLLLCLFSYVTSFTIIALFLVAVAVIFWVWVRGPIDYSDYC